MHRLAIGVALVGGAVDPQRGDDYYGAQAPFVELASCVVCRAFVQDDEIDCE